jgi:subtilisin family serine protease
MGFKFWRTPSSSFSWVKGYGDKPDSTSHPRVVKIHGGADTAFDFGGLQVNTLALPDSILIGGAALSVPLGASSTERLVYSMLLDIPSSTPQGTFYVDNIMFRDAGPWKFQDTAGFQYPPDFQGNANQSIQNPSAPPVPFAIVNACWQPTSGPMPSPPAETGQQAGKKPFDYREVLYFETGNVACAVVHVKFDGEIPDLESIGPRVRISRVGSKISRWGNHIAVSFPIELLPRVSCFPGVREIRLEEKDGPLLDYSAPIVEGYYADIDSSEHISGKGVVVGIVDTGIEWLHSDFRDSLGHTRILYLWDQTGSGTPPSGFTYGREWDSTAIDAEIAAPRSGPDATGHGTHVAGIAAGNGRSRTPRKYVGIAPEADLVVVKTDYIEDHIADAVKYVACTAAGMNKPWVVNLSIGKRHWVPTSRDGSAGYETQIDDIVTSSDSSFGSGRVVVIATGNDGDDSLHAHCDGPGEIELNVRTHGNTMDIDDSVTICILYRWQVGQTVSLTVEAPDQSTYGPVSLDCMSGPTYDSTWGWMCDTSDTSTDGCVRIFNNIFPSGGDPIANHPNDNVIKIELADRLCPQSQRLSRLREGVWKIRTAGGGFGIWDAYITSKEDPFPDKRKRFAAGSVSTIHTITSPATSHNCIAVGSFNSNRAFWDGADGSRHYTNPSPYLYPSDQISILSGLGPTRDGRYKPELFAPGYQIMSARAFGVTDGLSRAYYAWKMFWDPDTIHYITYGTSMSAPHVTGAVALMLDKNPHLTWSGIRDSLILSAFPADVTQKRMDLRVKPALKMITGVNAERPPSSTPIPEQFSLLQNYPNPFNPATRIKFAIPRNSSKAAVSHVQLDIVNILGQRVRTLVDADLTPGEHEVIWSGESDVGRPVASGVYFYRLVCDGKAETRKMLLLK